MPLIVGAVLPLAAPAAAATAHTASQRPAHAAGTASAAAGLPGAAAARTVTLITGDRVTETPAAPGSQRYTIQADPAPRPDGASAAITVTSLSDPGHPVQQYAMPSDAAPLVQAGVLDRGLFDLGYLSQLEDSDGGGTIPVVVQFASGTSGASMTRAVTGLGAGSPAEMLPGQHAAELRVTTARAAGFWAALTSRVQEAFGGKHPELADGITKVWLAGHVAAPQRSPRGEPSYTLTVTYAGALPHTLLFGCGDFALAATMCPASLSLLGISGSGQGATYNPDTGTCLQPGTKTDPCRTIRITYTVPPGVYDLDTQMLVNADNQLQGVIAADPQLTVSGNTKLTMNIRDAHRLTIQTPKATEPYNAVYSDQRTLPDGTAYLSLTFGGYGGFNYWAIPTTAVTEGSYYVKTNWILGKPLVTMTALTPRRLALTPFYPFDNRPNRMTRFNGNQTLALVDAGDGSKQDFSRVDATGKLALIDMYAGKCLIEAAQLKNALQAGAAGALAEDGGPAVPGTQGVGSCSLPLLPSWFWANGQPVDLPYAAIPVAQAAALRQMMSQGTVTIAVDDGGATPYTYNLTLTQENAIPASLDYSVSNSQLADVDSVFPRAGKPQFLSEDYADWLPSESLAGGVQDIFSAPSARQEFFGPVSPDLVYQQEEDAVTGRALEQILSESVEFAVYDRPGTTTEDWGDDPVVPGAPAAPPSLVRQFFPAEPYAYCSGCRQGNTVLPLAYATSSAAQHEISTLYGTDPSDVHLYHDGQQISPTANSYGIAEYTLPAASAAYRLTLHAGNSLSTWRFTSAKPAENQTGGTQCLGSILSGLGSGRCQPLPLIYLRYNAGVDLGNAVTASATHNLLISAYHQDPKAPAVTSLSVWTSTDGGKTWQAANSLTAQGDGNYTAAYTVPALSATDGAVSLKVEATDAGGNQVTQIIHNAWAITSSS